jgi:hypothetical protein
MQTGFTLAEVTVLRDQDLTLGLRSAPALRALRSLSKSWTLNLKVC